MSPTTVFISGANTGLGLEIVKRLLVSSQPYHILLGTRSLQKGQDALTSLQSTLANSASKVTLVQLDVTDDHSIQQAAVEVQRLPQLDVLINNAGVSLEMTTKLPERDIFNQSYDVNVTGAHLLTTALAGSLIRSSNPRLLFISSSLGSLALTEDVSSWSNQAPAAGWPKAPHATFAAYNNTKAAVNLLMRFWERELRNDGVKVWAVAPGFLATGLLGSPEVARRMGAIEPDKGAEVVVGVVEGKSDADVGKHVGPEGIIPW